MFEIKLCAAHARYNCVDCPKIPQKACADCETYAFVNTMVEKSDGRSVCQSCNNMILEKQRQKAQTNLFVQQTSLF